MAFLLGSFLLAPGVRSPVAAEESDAPETGVCEPFLRDIAGVPDEGGLSGFEADRMDAASGSGGAYVGAAPRPPVSAVPTPDPDVVTGRDPRTEPPKARC